MQDHIKSIRSWHYTLVLFAIAGLAMSVDLLNTDRSRKIMLSYLALEEHPDVFTGLRLYRDSIDAAIVRNCNGDPECPDSKWVRKFMEDYYRTELNNHLDSKLNSHSRGQEKTTLPPRNWMNDPEYTNHMLLTYATRMENESFQGMPLVNDLADSLFPRARTAETQYIRSSPISNVKHSPVMIFGPDGSFRVVYAGQVMKPDSFMVRAVGSIMEEGPLAMHDTVWVESITGARVALTSVMKDLRGLHIWKDLKDQNYAEGAALVRDKIDQEAINLPLVGLAIRKRSAILLLMTSMVLIALLMRLNLQGANRLFNHPLPASDLGTAYTSAYIGTNSSLLALAINYTLLLVVPLISFILLAWYSLSVAPTWQVAAMVVLTLIFALIAIGNIHLLQSLAQRADRYWAALLAAQGVEKNVSDTVD